MFGYTGVRVTEGKTNVYAGITCRPNERVGEHRRNGRTIISMHEIPGRLQWERRQVRFLEMQSRDGEDFGIDNVQEAFSERELRRRYGG